MPLPLIPLALAALGIYALGRSSSATVGAASVQMSYPMEDSEATRAALERYARAMAANNADWFKAHPDAPCCTECAKIGYIAPPNCQGNSACQDIKDAPALLRAKVGTCVDIVAFEVGAKLRDGKPAELVLVHETDSNGQAIPFSYHALMRTPAGLEDPAAKLQASAGCCGSCALNR